MNRFTISILSSVLLLGACAIKGPNTSAPEDKLLYDLGNLLMVQDKNTGLGLYDLDVRQRWELWDSTLKPLAKKMDEQAAAFAAAAPRLGDQAALMTVGNEAWLELQQPFVDAPELAAGRCVSGPPSKEDIGRGIMPKEDEKKMAAEVGQFVFGLRTSVNWTPAFRVTCAKSGTSFWVQMSQRKKGPDGAEQPLKLLRVLK